MLETVAGERPVAPASSTWVSPPCFLTASTMRPRFASRRDVCEPGVRLSSATRPTLPGSVALGEDVRHGSLTPDRAGRGGSRRPHRGPDRGETDVQWRRIHVARTVVGRHPRRRRTGPATRQGGRWWSRPAPDGDGGAGFGRVVLRVTGGD